MPIVTGFRRRDQSTNRAWSHFAGTGDITIAPRPIARPTDTFFTIGSCFANELRNGLEKRELVVKPTIEPEIHGYFPDALKENPAWGAWDERVHLQCYNSFSILMEFEKAFGAFVQNDDDMIVTGKGSETKYWDPYRRYIYAPDRDSLIAIKRQLDDAMSNAILTADIAVVTLGMTEAFFFEESGRAACEHNRHFADKLAFRSTTYEENLANVDRICSLYFGRFPDRHMVLSVSPVALGHTFTENDIVVANTESKSVLRAVAAAITRKWPNVVYFPSYEYCLSRDAFLEDKRHVRPETAAEIIDGFMRAHLKAPSPISRALSFLTEA